MKEFDVLELENQLCFPLYVCSKEIIKKYNPFLEKLDLTYTQYITMLVLWKRKSINVKELGELLYLDSGTLTPLLKKLENKGFIERKRSSEDERILNIFITKEGEELKEQAKIIPEKITKCINLSMEEISNLYKLLYKVLDDLNEK